MYSHFSIFLNFSLLSYFLTEYGGIYVDTDEILLRSLDDFRDSSYTMGLAHDGSVGSALIMAVKNAPFLSKWNESYRSFHPNEWGNNSVLMARTLATKYPKLINLQDHHCVFFPHGNLLYDSNYKWSHSYAIHVYHQDRMDILNQYDGTTIQTLNNTLGAVGRYILYDDKELCA